MQDVSGILTKKNYGRRSTIKVNSRVRSRLLRAGEITFSYPKWLPFLFILVTGIAALGEDKTLNARFGGLPKALTLLVPVIAFLILIVSGELKRFRYIGKPALMYIVYWGMLCLWSVILWVINFSSTKAINRGVDKMEYQTIAIVVAITAVFIFGEKTVDYFAAGIFLGNGLIALIEMPNYGGPVASIESVINMLTSFGDTHGFSAAMEIHEVTFLYGLFIVYYAVFAKRDDPSQKRRNRIYIVLSFFFMLLGFKRLLLFCAPLIAVIAWLIMHSKKPFRHVMALGIFWTVFFFVFLYVVYTGYLSQIANSMGVNMMGRDYIWKLVKKFYRLSPTYLGQGFGTVDGVIVSELYHAGLIDQAYPLHNDVLKVFIEFGFPGLIIWSGAQYILFPILFKKMFDTETAVLYMSLLTLMSTTYLTDNTAFYFWCMMALRLIPLAYGVYRRNKTGSAIKEDKKKWAPPSKDDFAYLVSENMAGKESQE